MRIVMTEQERRAVVEKLGEIIEWLDQLVPPDEVSRVDTGNTWKYLFREYRDAAVRRVKALKELFEGVK